MDIHHLNRLHTKIIHILDLCIKCDEYCTAAKNRLIRFDKANWDEPIRLSYSREEIVNHINKYVAIQKRLLSYYFSLSEKSQKIINN
jgi:hypothetical protein